MLKHPEDIAECTLQPLRRCENLDVAASFSDALVTPAAMGMEGISPGGVRMQMPNPLQAPMELEQRVCPTTNEEAQ